MPPDEFRFVTVTRDRDGAFEVINDGAFTDEAIINEIIDGYRYND